MTHDVESASLLEHFSGALSRLSRSARGRSGCPLHRHWLKRFLGLANGIPLHDSISRLWAALDPDVLRECFLHWVRGR
ncbi:MAG: transposase family protein [Synechococcaceae cyanobacterium SM2_3_2]|nr:transposase family protein [Synechococcaceae cyanobacterium SM2_3_2]